MGCLGGSTPNSCRPHPRQPQAVGRESDGDCRLGGGCHVDPDALENRARPLCPDAPTAGDIFAYSEHAVGRAGRIGARVIGKVKEPFHQRIWF